MPPPRFTQIDHVVIMVDALDDAAGLWRRLGFTLSPRGQHSDTIGTANHTLMFGDDYVELLAIRHDTYHNRPWRDALRSGGEGLYGVALATDSADATRDALMQGGIAAEPVLAFERMVERTGHAPIPARFRVTSTPTGTIDGVKLFVCEHLTRHAVWLPELQVHANTATRILRLDMAVPDLAAARAQWARLLGPGPNGRSGVGPGAGRATVRIGRHGLRLTLAPRESARMTRLTLAVADLQAAARALKAGGVAHEKRGKLLLVRQINGVDIAFMQQG